MSEDQKEKELVAVDMEEISLKELIMIILKGKWLIIAITIICCVAGVFGMYMVKNATYTVSSIIEFSFDSIDKGLNPDGSRFDVNEIRSPAIISKAFSNLGYELAGIDEIRKRLEIKPILPSSIAEITKLKLEEGEVYSYHAGSFEVVFSGDAEVEFTRSEITQIVAEITNVYTQTYIERYSNVGLIANILTQFDAELLDYPEMSTVINKQLNLLSSYLVEKAAEAPFFRATETGYSFDDILQSVYTIRSIDLASMDSTIGLYLLTKDKQKLINSYLYSIELKEVERSKAEQEAIIAKEMMESFDTSSNSIIIPGIGADLSAAGDFGSKESYYDALADRSTKASIQASDILYDIQYLSERIERLENDTILYADKQRAIKSVMDTVERIQADLAYWIEVSNALVDEYYSVKYAQSIVPLVAPQIVSSMQLLMAAAVSLAVGLMLGIFIVLFKSYWLGAKTNVAAKNTLCATGGEYGA